MSPKRFDCTQHITVYTSWAQRCHNCWCEMFILVLLVKAEKTYPNFEAVNSGEIAVALVSLSKRYNSSPCSCRPERAPSPNNVLRTCWTSNERTSLNPWRGTSTSTSRNALKRRVRGQKALYWWSTEESLSRARDGRGEARRTAAGRTAAHTAGQRAPHPALWRRNEAQLSLMPTCTTCFEELLTEKLVASYLSWAFYLFLLFEANK